MGHKGYHRAGEDGSLGWGCLCEEHSTGEARSLYTVRSAVYRIRIYSHLGTPREVPTTRSRPPRAVSTLLHPHTILHTITP